MRKCLERLITVIAIVALSISLFAADNPKDEPPDDGHDGEAFAFYIENDSRNIGGPGSDQAYSNGFKFSYLYAEDRVPAWATNTVKKLNILSGSPDKAKINFGFSIGHQIYTPNNTQATTLITDDRPYAAWLYTGFAASIKEAQTVHIFEVDIGIIGPSARGKEVQNNFHDLIRKEHAEGWANSLYDEAAIQFFYQNRFRSIQSQYLDLIPYYGGGVGSVQLGAHVGALVRIGINLPDDFGPSRPSANDGDSFVSPATNPDSNRKSYFVFGGLRGNAIGRNVFLDGNTYRDSPRVKKYPFTFETEFGAGTQILPFAFVWRFVTRSPEFEQRSRFNSFAGINIIYFL